jgi:hypothetical protein
MSFCAVEVKYIFGVNNVSTGIVEFSEKLNDNEYNNLK